MTSSQPNEQFLVFIAMDRPAALDSAVIAESLRRKAVDDATAVEVAGDSASGHPLMIMINRTPYTVMQVDRPLPKDACETALRFSRWPEATPAIASCTAHLIVAPVAPIKGSHPMALQQAVDLTRLCAALSEAPEVRAILWTSADIIVQPARFRLAVDELVQKRIAVMASFNATTSGMLIQNAESVSPVDLSRLIADARAA